MTENPQDRADRDARRDTEDVKDWLGSTQGEYWSLLFVVLVIVMIIAIVLVG